jgi:hypothetical protein
MRLTTVMVVLGAILGCRSQRRSPDAQGAWSLIDAPAALALCRDSLGSTRQSSCEVDLHPGHLSVIGDSVGTPVAFVRVWPLAWREVAAAFAAKQAAIAATWGPGQTCREGFVIWPTASPAVTLVKTGPDGPADSTQALWAIRLAGRSDFPATCP